MNLRFEREYRDLAHVPRWGIIPVIHRQSVAEHSYYVTLYASHIMFALKITEPYALEVLHHCLEHDRSECYMSDIPGPVKRAIVDSRKEEVYAMRGDDHRFHTNKFDQNLMVLAIRKLADIMDEYAYWVEEGTLGNGRAHQLLKIIMPRLLAAADHLAELSSNDVRLKVIDIFLANCGAKKIIPGEDGNVVAA